MARQSGWGDCGGCGRNIWVWRFCRPHGRVQGCASCRPNSNRRPSSCRREPSRSPGLHPICLDATPPPPPRNLDSGATPACRFSPLPGLWGHLWTTTPQRGRSCEHRSTTATTQVGRRQFSPPAPRVRGPRRRSGGIPPGLNRRQSGGFSGFGASDFG